jgi:hypothetical protein
MLNFEDEGETDVSGAEDLQGYIHDVTYVLEPDFSRCNNVVSLIESHYLLPFCDLFLDIRESPFLRSLSNS